MIVGGGDYLEHGSGAGSVLLLGLQGLDSWSWIQSARPWGASCGDDGGYEASCIKGSEQGPPQMDSPKNFP